MPPCYSRIAAKALGDRKLTGTDIRVLGGIGLHDSGDPKGCCAKAETLAKESGVSVNQFFASTRELETAGYITRESKPGRPSIYRLVGLPKNGVPQKAVDLPAPKGGVRVPQKAVRRSPKRRYATTINNSVNNSINSTPRPIASREARRPGVPDVEPIALAALVSDAAADVDANDIPGERRKLAELAEAAGASR